MKIHYKKETVGYLDITFWPKWDYITLTRPYVENFLLINMADKNNIHKVGLAASELLENATKYSGGDSVRMIVKKLKERNEIQLSVFNYLGKEDAAKVINRIEEMNKQESLEYYIYRMKESVVNKERPSELGLARIYHETKAQIKAIYYEDEGVIEVRAVFSI